MIAVECPACGTVSLVDDPLPDALVCSSCTATLLVDAHAASGLWQTWRRMLPEADRVARWWRIS